ncbi:16S rRNA (cytosine(1402)-N(4))-methyltransferase RsmH [Candidatus Giovannonibacteria bacterium]|nr:16S rRNA (cytosine(1402)-N(4))-methyltransferase RsmH [Candidatus Giovannonibacteria bacterium]
MEIHTPVLVEEIKAHLNLKEGDKVIDATLDGGGHARVFLEAVGKSGAVLGIERDPEMFKIISARKEEEGGIWKNLRIVNENFRDIRSVALKEKFLAPNAILFDLGVSRWHFEASGKGFSFKREDEPLMMNFGKEEGSAAQILNSYPKDGLLEIFSDYGELDRRASRVLAEAIVNFRKHNKILTVGDLKIVAEGAILNRRHIAQAFQALRIVVNDELGAIEEGIRGAYEILPAGGKMAVISYHSLEDRIVKNFFRKMKDEDGAELGAKKPIMASAEELKRNPSANSAKLRILIKKIKIL